MRRWLRFNLVGLAGFAVQLTTLAVLTRMTPLPIAFCVACAVVAAIAHNFYWHERYTWRVAPVRGSATEEAHAPCAGGAALANRQRVLCARRARVRRCLAFMLTCGMLSIVSNIIVTIAVATLVARLPLLLANAIAVALTSLINFLIADRAIFRSVADV